MINRRTMLAGIPFALAAGCMPGRNQASIMTNPAFSKLEKRIGGRLGVALVDSQGNIVSSHRGNERFAMCSTFKAPLASALTFAHARGDVDMNAKFRLKSEDSVPYMPFFEKHLKDGTAVSLGELAKAAVQTSDNAAANLVLKAIGGPKGFTDFVYDQGDRVTRLDRWEPELNENIPGDPRDTTSPVAMAWLMHKLLIDNSTKGSSRSNVQNWMIGSKTGADRIRAGLPAGWPVGNKTGTAGGSAYNDIAIIWPSRAEYGTSPVILTVYTDRPTASAKKVNATIADVARVAVRLIGLPD
ncbi:MAG: class A beta-lactamase [Parasphingorhabdus sp.]|uniref:class A beta-lactamase n=1 Tax=Parasphingorhabdus sp. TaxID=2709688 RepID=UPI003297C619